MGAADIESSGEQERTEITVNDYRLDYEHVPEKRKNRARKASLLICATVAVLVIIFCIVRRNADEYYETHKNTTNVCYRKEKKMTFSSMFATMLSLIGIVLGTLVDRLSLVVEERHHVDRRYSGSWKKMFKACFSGILWGPVFFLLSFTVIVVIILILTTGKHWFEMQYLVYIFSGIGVGPLVMLLLNLNAQCQVHISTILEDKETYVANGLAWSYYFNHLEKELPKLNQTNIQYLETLSSNKLLLLIPHDCDTTKDVTDLDQNITKLQFHTDVYKLKISENDHEIYKIQYANEPLQTLRKMALSDGIRAVTRQTLEQEVKLFCRTLNEILKDPPDQTCREMVVLVPFKVENLRTDLQNGGLVRCIMAKVDKTACPTQVDNAPAFVKLPEGNDKKSHSKNDGNQIGSNDARTSKKLQQNGKEQKESKKKKYKSKTSDETELKIMIPKESEKHQPPENTKSKPNIRTPITECGNDLGGQEIQKL